jgi:hypothetical protein
MTQYSLAKDYFGSVARIWEPGRTKPIGMGFLVDGQHLMTCAHVVDDALGNDDSGSRPMAPDGLVGVDFPVSSRPLRKGFD